MSGNMMHQVAGHRKKLSSYIESQQIISIKERKKAEKSIMMSHSQ